MYRWIILLAALPFVSAADPAPPWRCGTFHPAWESAPEPKKQSISLDRPSRPTAPKGIGDTEWLTIYNFRTSSYRSVEFVYRGAGRLAVVAVQKNMWDVGLVSQQSVDDLLRRFEVEAVTGSSKGIFDIEESIFGSVSPLGGDSTIYIVLAEIEHDLPEGEIVAGYFSRTDQSPTSGQYGNSNSNYRNMVVIHAGLSEHEQDAQASVLAHEFQHLIHYQYDRSEERWLNEGASVYAEARCGYTSTLQGRHFFTNPNVGLYRQSGLPTRADYDKAYMLIQYLADRFGPDLITRIVQEPRHGIPAINIALNSFSSDETFENVFMDWATANLLPKGHADGYKNFDPLAAHFVAGMPAITSQTWPDVAFFGTLYFRGPQPPSATRLSSGSSDIRYGARSVVIDPDGTYRVVRWFHRPGYGWVTCRGEDHQNLPNWTVVAQWHRIDTNSPLAAVVTGLPTEPPLLLALSPVAQSGDVVSPYQTPLSVTFSKPIDADSLSITASGRQTGPLPVRWLIDDTNPSGPCDGPVTVRGLEGEWPVDDTVTIRLEGIRDLSGQWFGESTRGNWEWSFPTGSKDKAPPRVAFGVLQHPEMPSRLHLLAISDESLHPRQGEAVSLTVNGTPVDRTESITSSGRYWRGRSRITQPGEYDIAVRAADLAGNLADSSAYSYTALFEAAEDTSNQTIAARPAK